MQQESVRVIGLKDIYILFNRIKVELLRPKVLFEKVKIMNSSLQYLKNRIFGSVGYDSKFSTPNV